MFPNWLLIIVSFSYGLLLCCMAIFGHRYKSKVSINQQKLIYALSLGVYCTSWGFLGTSGQAANNAFSFLPIYVVPILLFVFGWHFIQRIIRISLKLNTTSIADLLANRYGQSKKLAVLVTLAILLGTLPYLALQIKAIVNSYIFLRQDDWLSPTFIGLIVSLLLATFTTIFGIRDIDITERHLGVMIAVAFESLLKIIAFLSIGIFVSFFLFDSPQQLWSLTTFNDFKATQMNSADIASWLGLCVIVLSAFMCLPRQFQTMFVEIKNTNNTQWSRWIFPIYLLIFAFFAIPLGQAGKLLYADTLNSDAYVLFLPAFNGSTFMSLLGFIGSISAASAMVIVSAIALSTMLSNEIVYPSFLKNKQDKKVNFNDFKRNFLIVRKLLVLLIFTLCYGVYSIAPSDTLASLGENSFGALAQIGPAFFAAFIWRRANLNGAYYGILSGITIWFFMNLLPVVGFYTHPLGDSPVNPTTFATLIALFVNVSILMIVSYFGRQTIQEQIQLESFFNKPNSVSGASLNHRKFETSELLLLIRRFMGDEKANEAHSEFAKFKSTLLDKGAFQTSCVRYTETLLASVMGSTSSKLILSLVFDGRKIALSEVADFVQNASVRQQDFSYDVLQSAIEYANDGISVIDENLNIVAWNQVYLNLFNYPPELVYIGCHVSELIRHNLIKRRKIPMADVERQVLKRVQFLESGSIHNTEQNLSNGTIIRIKGNPLAGGGFVMSFTDVTYYRDVESLLQLKNQNLESRVLSRTTELQCANYALEQSNNALARADQKTFAANMQKSQYLRACSHDLLQPISAARLFSASLASDNSLTPKQHEKLLNIETALNSANDLIRDLNEAAQIDSGAIKPVISNFKLQDLFVELFCEFELTCESRDILFEIISTSISVETDYKWLRRILQNLLSNACRYAPNGRLLLGCRRCDDFVIIHVIDTGIGIPSDKQEVVFEQFTQLSTSNENQGLGLGLNIVKGLANVLGHNIQLRSVEGRGCNFSITVPISICSLLIEPKLPEINLRSVNVLCVDNEPQLTSAMSDLLTSWGCRVIIANSVKEALNMTLLNNSSIDIMLVDFQLNDTLDGIELMNEIRQDNDIPGVLITASTEKWIFEEARSSGFDFLEKSAKPAALKQMIGNVVANKLTHNYANSDRF